MTDSKQTGYADIVLGLQFGDEGKAKIVDMLAENYEVVARFNGGSNAGHTIEVDDRKIALRQVPSGVIYPNKILYIGSGVVVDLVKLKREIQDLEACGLSIRERLFITQEAAFLQPYHFQVESDYSESVGTTRNGIGPVYASKSLRTRGDSWMHLRLCDLVSNTERCVSYMKENGQDYEIPSEQYDEIVDAFEFIKTCIPHDRNYLVHQVRKGARVLFEGAQSFMLDVARGTVPFVTSSHTGAAAAFVGGDLPPQYHRKTIGVAKVIMSRVGPGPFVSEVGGAEAAQYALEGAGSTNTRSVEAERFNAEQLLGSEIDTELSIALRMLSCEYGTVTGRPRRIGALDLVQLREAIISNGVSELYLTKCDLLKYFSRSKFEGIPLITDYHYLGEKSTSSMITPDPRMQVLEGFTTDISGLSDEKNLPNELRHLLRFIEQETDCPIAAIGVGPDRKQLISLEGSHA